MNNIKQQKFKKFLPIVITTVFVLIAIGGIVRSTGAGMGCPDWPKCFGQYIPPYDISQLPADYKTQYAVAGRVIADFSPIKTWIEYFNRLAGVWTGFALLILAYFSFGYRKSDKKIFWLTQLSLFLVILNGWLGSKVVSTHLMPGVITAHMLLAIFLVFCLQQIKHFLTESSIPALSKNIENLKKYKGLALVLLILTLVQVVFGTQVREQIDHITNSEPNLARSNWLDRLGSIFFIHRSYSIVLILGYFYLLRKLMEDFKESLVIQRLCINIALIIIAEIAAGVSLAYFSFPAALQPIHLLLSIILMSYQYELYAVLKLFSKK